MKFQIWNYMKLNDDDDLLFYYVGVTVDKQNYDDHDHDADTSWGLVNCV